MTVTGARLSGTSTPWLVRVTAVCCLFGAEAIHTSVIGEHIEEWLPLGVFFVVLSMVEGLLAVILFVQPTRRVELVAIAVSLGTVALWVFTRTVGLPFGPEAGEVEPIARADTVASILELVTAVALIASTTVTASMRRSAADYLRAALIVSAVVALTLFGYVQASAPGHA